ncbi:MFS transporter [Palleronia sp.]|uniref:MFS transporter n=1 Tax=Palleronia sp. TaxID=1940284 RepID=UPI0035C8682C
MRRFETRLFEALTHDTTSPGGLSPAAHEVEAGAFVRHAGALAMTKLADGLLSPKLILAWLLTHLGAGSVFVGLLVPIRESLALLPQIVVAPRLQALARRKWAWAAGSLVQGLACAGIVLAGLTFEGAAAGVAICTLLAILAIARSVCSVTIKDLLGKTVGASRRGTASGLAASVASIGVIAFALILVLGGEARFGLAIAALSLAAALWIAAAAFFATLEEEARPGKREGAPWAQLALIREDPQLRLFIVVRGFLTATALAPPYLILLSPGEGAFDRLGALILASSAASFLSAYVWGRLADRSSRQVLMASGALGAVGVILALVFAAMGVSGTWWALPLALFVLMIAYDGVRQGRSTYLVDMAPDGRRAAYTAVANAVIGVVLLGSGLFGALASLAGPNVTLWLFAAMSAAACLLAIRLDEVE